MIDRVTSQRKEAEGRGDKEREVSEGKEWEGKGASEGRKGWFLTHSPGRRGTRDPSPLVTFPSRDQEPMCTEVPLLQVRSLFLWRKRDF